MIFKQLILKNFGQYKGEHSIDLRTTKTRPILLVGGQNGGGKTTILDAMQLGLYGKRSNCYRRADQRWDQYLKGWINHTAEAHCETRIKVCFLHTYNGRDAEYRVEFSWKHAGKSVQERKEIFINDELDANLTESWDKVIDAILPARLSTLFFFDGEQIENLIRPEAAQQFLESAVNELLGIGVIDQLSRDLTTLNRNKSVGSKSKSELEQLKTAEAEYETVQKQICHIQEHLVILRKQKRDEQKRLESTEADYEAQGGKLLDEQAINESLKQEIHKQLESLNRQIVKEQSGCLPLSLVRDQLGEIRKQIKQEQEAADACQQQTQLERLNQKILNTAEKAGATNTVLEALTELTAKELSRLTEKASQTDVYLNVPQDSIVLLDATLNELPAAEKHYRNMLKQKSELELRQQELEAKLTATPEKGVVEILFNQRRECAKTLTTIDMDLAAKEELLESLHTKATQAKERVIRLLGEAAQVTADEEDTQRTIYYSLQTQKYLKTFREQLLRKNLGRLEYYILDSFQHLIKKKSLVEHLTINPADFSITLTNKEQKVIPAEKLSAGERQLLAISIFWGLQKASNRPIPVMIDTPLGRLDSSHRAHLIRRYFPEAAHQLVLLSTDEEIIGDYLKQLDKHIHQKWLITYDEDAETSRIQEGYFQ